MAHLHSRALLQVFEIVNYFDNYTILSLRLQVTRENDVALS